MPIAFIGDIHGNLPALEAVLADIRDLQIADIRCHGDICYGGPWVRECAQAVRDLCRVITRGNTDDLIAAPEEGNVIAQRDREALGEELANWLADLPVEHEEGVVLAHATRRSNADRLPSLDADDAVWLNAYGPVPAVVVCGHNHVAFTRQVGRDLRVLNTGAVGAPFDGDPRASYLVGALEGDLWAFSHRRVEYDREPAARAFDDLGHREARRFARAIRTGHP